MITRRQLHCAAVLVATFVGVFSASWALAGPNIMAIGEYKNQTPKRATGRESFSGKEVIFSFDDAEHDFGHVVVRASQPNSIVVRDLAVRLGGRGGLVIDTNGANRGGETLNVDELEIWLRVQGKIEPSRIYEWEGVFANDKGYMDEPLKVYLPLMWADGKQIVNETTMTLMTYDSLEQRMQMGYTGFVWRGSFRTEYFEKQTGAAYVVLKPELNGNVFAIPYFFLREADWDLGDADDLKSDMPGPIRYVPIETQAEDMIEQAFDGGFRFLGQLQNRAGFWGPPTGGEEAISITALTVSTLEEQQNPVHADLDKAMKWLSEQEPPPPPPNQPGMETHFGVGTAATRLYCLARYGGLGKYSKSIYEDVEFLKDSQLEDGGWSAGDVPQNLDPLTYMFAALNAGLGVGTGYTPNRTRSDNLSSFLVARALQEAHYAGVETNRRMWKRAADYWRTVQAPDGGFRAKHIDYGGAGELSSVDYTSLGVAGLILTMDMAYGVTGRRCNGYAVNKSHLRAISSGIAFIERYYDSAPWEKRLRDAIAIPPDPYAVPMFMQQFGAVSGINVIAGKVHFRENVPLLMQHWFGNLFGVRNREAPSIARTVWALNTLASGAAPTIVQRVIVGAKDKPFAEFNMDAHHLSRYLIERMHRPLNWRRTTLDRSVRELLEVPLLYINVVGEPDITKEQWKKIRQYCFAGGTVLLNIHDEASDYRDEIVKQLEAAFPEYKTEPLAQDDNFFEEDSELKVPAGMKVLGNGFRHFVFIPGESWSCIFQLYQLEEEKLAFDFSYRLMEYATSSNPPRDSFRRSTYPPRTAPSKSLAARYLETGGDVPAYPDQLELLDKLARANYRLGIKSKDRSRDADMLWVSVTGDKAPKTKTSNEIMDALEDHKFVLVDVVSGNKDWDEAFRAELFKMDPGISLHILRRSDPVFTGEIKGTQGFSCASVGFRKPLWEDHKFKKVFKMYYGRCELYEIRYEGKMAGVYCAYDLSSGVGYQSYPECRGVRPAWARALVLNNCLVAYSWKARGGAMDIDELDLDF